jgi:heme-degrading monooxygenase HmoA
MFLSISRFAVANALDDVVREAFLGRPHLVDSAPGFIRMEVANPCDDAKEFWLLTWWQDEESFSSWHHSHAYHASHAGIPKGLKLDPECTAMLRFDVVAS